MKKVFEGFTNQCNLDCNRPPLFEEGMHQFHLNIIDKLEGDGWDIPVRITVEDLPESKPEPINWLASGGGKSANTSDFKSEPKNCGNCGAGHTGCKTEPGKVYCSAWQPKPAEPQGWEQRLKTQFPDAYGEGPLMAFIRAEIERVHAGYAPLISAIEMAFKEADFLPDGRLTRKALAVFEPIRKAEQNRRGEGGK